MKFFDEEKLKDISLTNNNIYVLLDFDRTITSYDSLDTWAVAGMAADSGCNEQINNLYNIYRPIETDYSISYGEKYNAMEKWYSSCMDLYFKYNLSKYRLKEAVKSSNLVFRSGAKEFLKYTYANNIPVVILSAGIGSVIEEFLKEKECYFENIYLISNTFIYDENGNAFKLKNSLIHTMNKNIEGHLNGRWEKEFTKRKYKILFGDTIEDIYMISKEKKENSIKIAFLDKDLDNLSKYKENFDIVLTDKESSFDVAREIMKF